MKNKSCTTFALLFALTQELAGQQVRPLAPAAGRTGAVTVEIPKIEPELNSYLNSSAPVDVFLLLDDQPQRAIARKHLDPVRAEVGWLHQQVVQQLRRQGPMEPKLASLVKRRDELELEARRNAIREMQDTAAPAQQNLAARLEAAGAEVGRRYWLFNMIEVRLPGNLIPVIAEWPGIFTIKMAHQRHSMVESSVPATNIPKFWEAGYMGATQTVLVLDSGINSTHPWFNGLQVTARVSLESASKRACFDDDPRDTGDRLNHGTPVAGILASRGPKGMLPELGRLISMKVVAKARNTAGCPEMLIEEADWVAGVESALAEFPVQIVNVSLGGGPGTEDDLANWVVDRAVVLFDLSFFIAAGNDGESSRYFQVSSPASSYNGIAVAAVDHNRTVTRLDNNPAAFSSKGPTPSGRAKPDIACPGVRIVSADGLSEGPSREVNGTSFAAPHCAGIGAALADAGVKSALARKALLLNSTDAPDWTRTVGFGEANAERAMENRASVITGNLRLTGGRYIWLYTGDVRGAARATLVWNRHIRSVDAAANGASWYLTNLDMAVYDGGTGKQVLVTDQTRDNVERFNLRGTGGVVVKVHTPAAALDDAEDEQFALAFSGTALRPVRGPRLETTCAPERGTVMVFGTINFNCTIRNTGDLDLRAGEPVLAYIDPWTQRPVLSNLEPIAAGRQVTKRISLKAQAASRLGPAKLEFAAAAQAYGETWLGVDGAADFTVIPAALQDCTPQYKLNANLPLNANRQNFTVDLSFPKYDARNPGLCKWTVDPAGFLTVFNSAGSALGQITGSGDKLLTFLAGDAPKRNAGTAPRQATITIRITSDIDERNAPAPLTLNPPITIPVTQSYAQ